MFTNNSFANSNLGESNVSFKSGTFSATGEEMTRITLDCKAGKNRILVRVNYFISSQNVLVSIKDESNNVIYSETQSVTAGGQEFNIDKKIDVSSGSTLKIVFKQTGYIASSQNYVVNAVNIY